MKKKSVSPTPAPAVAMIAAEKLAQLCNLTTRRLYQLANENKIPPPINGNFPMLASIQALFKFYQSDGEEIQKERLKKLTAERHKAELDLEVQRKKYISMSDMQRAVTRFSSSLRGQFLSMPKRLDMRLSLETDPQKIYELLEAEVREVMSSVALDAGVIRCPHCSKTLLE